MLISFKKVKDSGSSMRQQVYVDDELIGDVWREEVRVLRKGAMAHSLRWRWFAKAAPDPLSETSHRPTLGRGTRAALFITPGFDGKNKAFDALMTQRQEAAKDVGASPHAGGDAVECETHDSTENDEENVGVACDGDMRQTVKRFRVGP